MAIANIQEIAKKFGLEATEISPVSHAVLSNVYIINGTHILRSRTLEQDALKRFGHEQRLLRKIREAVSVQFPELLSTKDGKTHTIVGGLLWTAYPLIKGDVLCAWWNLEKLSEAETENIFVTLRELHDKTRGRLAYTNYSYEYHFLEDARTRLRDIGTDIPPTDQRRIDEATKRVSVYEQHLSEKDLCFVHGDYHPGNVVFNKKRVVGLLDTDWSRKGSPLEDLAYAVMMFLRDYRDAHFVFRKKNYRKFLGWYGDAEQDAAILREYILLYAFYDTHLFRELDSLPNRERIFKYQKELLIDLCRRF